MNLVLIFDVTRIGRFYQHLLVQYLFIFLHPHTVELVCEWYRMCMRPFGSCFVAFSG